MKPVILDEEPHLGILGEEREIPGVRWGIPRLDERVLGKRAQLEESKLGRWVESGRVGLVELLPARQGE